ncbi:AfsR/SARP family transcriptional regulator [Nocardia sp. NPDC046763]|uniref:AfsR/SARP family transcriptional regulator n=1 Tax=Nocardia sp. NPDC046763 TaxID=3155256 RepID=UPI0033EA43E7
MIKFGVLGSLQCCIDGVGAVPSAPKQRQLLALLLMNANRVISADYCIEELWESAPPSSASSTLQTYVMQLRKCLGEHSSNLDRGESRLETRERGYLLHVGPGEFDVDVFEDKVRLARLALAAEDDDSADSALRAALAVWRGPVFTDIKPGPVLTMWATSLNEVRLSILEHRIEVDLRLGRHRELIGELSGMVQRSPLLESLHAHLIIALYRSGRQAHALQVYERLRHRLAEELGLEPTPALQQLHHKVLRSAPELAPPPTIVAASRYSAELIAGRLRPQVDSLCG